LTIFVYTLSNENQEEKIKKLIWLIIFLVAGYLVYNHFSSRPLSEEEQVIKKSEQLEEKMNLFLSERRYR